MCETFPVVELALFREDEEDEADDAGGDGGDGDDAPEDGERALARDERELDVHAVGRGDQCRNREEDRHHGEILHHVVQVVVDQRGERIERAVQDVRVDGRRLQGLLELDERVLELVAVVLGERKLARRVGAGEGDRVGLEGRREVDERLLDREKAQEDVVRDRFVQLLLPGVRALVDVVDVAQEEDAAVPQEAEGEAVLVARRTDAADLVEEGRGDRRAHAADGDDRLAEEDDAERDRAVGDDRIVLVDGTRHVDDEHRRVVVIVESRTFVRIERVGEEVARDLREGQHALELRRRRLDQVDPARLAEVGDLLEAAILPPVDRHHGQGPPFRRLTALSRAGRGSGRRSRTASGCPECRT